MTPKVTVRYTIHPITRYALRRSYTKTMETVEGNEQSEGGSESYGEFECLEQAERLKTLLAASDPEMADPAAANEALPPA